MSINYNYIRTRKRYSVFNGVFDPSQDQTQMETLFRETQDSYTRTVVSSPGGVGGYSHYFNNAIGVSQERQQFVTHLKGAQIEKRKCFPIFSPLKWKYRAEFRMRIADDETHTDSNYKLATSAGFCLDGAFMADAYYPGFVILRRNRSKMAVMFNVAAQYTGIVNTDYNGVLKDLYKTSWSGALDTWYDVRIDWEFDYYTNPLIILVTVYINKTQIFSQNINLDDWRNEDRSAFPASRYIFNHAIMNHCGIGISANKPSGSATTGNVQAYFKDILIILDDLKLPIEYEYSASLMSSNEISQLRATYLHDDTKQLCKGSDIQLWFRNSAIDNWHCAFRGKVRDALRTHKKMVEISADGYETVYHNEKMDDITLTTKTANEIFIEAVNNPYKENVYTIADYFDTTSTTYSRAYKQVPKIDIMLEMAVLAGHIFFLDYANNFHFQKPRSNQTGIHLVYGRNKIATYNYKAIDIIQPNIIRIIGTGVFAEREITNNWYHTESKNVKSITRLDLTTQAEVDDALDYYINLFNTDIQSLEVTMRANWDLKVGYIVTVSVPQLNLNSTKFLIINITGNHQDYMQLTLLEVSPDMALIISELYKTTDRTETIQYGSDTVNSDTNFNLESKATLLVGCTYEVTYNAAIVAEGETVITDECIDNILETWNNASGGYPNKIAYGDGVLEPSYETTALTNELAESVFTSTTLADKIGEFTTKQYHRSVEFEVNNFSGTFTLREICLKDDAGNIIASAAIDDVAIAGTFTVKFTFSFDVLPGSTYVTYKGLDAINNYFYNQTWTNLEHIRLAVTDEGYPAPHPMITNNPEQLGVSWEVDLQSTTYSTSLNKPKDEITFQDSGDFGVTEFVSGRVEIGLVLSDTVAGPTVGKEYHIIGFRPTFENTEDYNGLTRLFKITLKVLRSIVVYN